MDLTPNFSYREMTHSDVGVRRGLENVPGDAELSNLKRLCEELLEPVRELLGVPLHVNSGFRSPEVNAAVGGVKNSAHMEGRACDFVPVGMGLREAVRLIQESRLSYDQMILEYGSWIHIAIPRNGSTPRRQTFAINTHSKIRGHHDA